MPKKVPKIIKEIQEKKLKEFDYSYQKNISFSQYSMWKSCPKKWSLHYKEGHKKFLPSIHSIFGTAFHETLQHYLKVMYEESGVAADKLDLEELLKDNLRNNYKEEYKKNNNQHFSSSIELREFYDDGVEILSFIKKKRGQYFTKKGWHLVGIELPILLSPNKNFPNVLYMGFLDVVLYHEPSNTFKIIDIKTSTNGWNKYAKKDENKQFQLVLYKKFFAEQFGVPIDSIDVEFFIVKRKLYDDCDFPQKRVQEFAPASGKVKLTKATRSLNEFLEECFVRNKFSSKEMLPNPSKFNCGFCPYKDDKELCGLGVNL